MTNFIDLALNELYEKRRMWDDAVAAHQARGQAEAETVKYWQREAEHYRRQFDLLQRRERELSQRKQAVLDAEWNERFFQNVRTAYHRIVMGRPIRYSGEQDDQCGAGSPGGKGFEKANTCGQHKGGISSFRERSNKLHEELTTLNQEIQQRNEEIADLEKSLRGETARITSQSQLDRLVRDNRISKGEVRFAIQ